MPKLREAPKTPVNTEDNLALDQTENKPGSIQEPDTQADDAAEVFQKEMETLRRSEAAEKQRADQAEQQRGEALRLAREREVEVGQLQQRNTQSQLEAVSAALAAAKSEAESAERDIDAAIGNGDSKAQAAAYRRLARAESDASRLEDGKLELEERAKAPPPAPRQEPQGNQLPQAAQNWLRAHPEYLQDHRKNAKIQSLHWDVIDEGHAAFSPGYFESLEQHLGLRQAAADEGEDPPPAPRQPSRGPIVSAPVSRQAPSSPGGPPRSGRITLTPQQKEYAKIAGVSEEEYAKGVQKLEAEKLNGNYGGRP